MAETALDRLCAAIREDLAAIAHPRQPWLVAKRAPDGSAALDVLVVGAGQSGIAAAFALMRRQITNIAVVDRAPYGREGPWVTYARMPTLRSPKEFTGPDLDIPSLTYQRWHEARYGAAHWRALERIAREDWNDYLLFVRAAVGVGVANDTEVLAIGPAGGLLAVRLRDGAGERVVFARKVLLCTGQEGVGRWELPECLAAVPARLRARSCDAIDFEALRGRTVAVLGAGASAFDNAAMALEAGARVHLFCRRPQPQTIQPYRWLTFRGFLAHIGEMPDEWRWRFMQAILALREGFPQETYDRCARHAGFRLHVGAGLTGASEQDGRLLLETTLGPFAADFAIAAGGVVNDFGARPELAGCADNIACWSDRYVPPAAEADARVGSFPYLGPDYAFAEKVAGRTPWLANIHLFAIGATMSFGASGSSINAMTTAVPLLAHGISRGLFASELGRFWEELQGYDVAQAVVRETHRLG